jgi:3-oxoadipate enol-lactonase
MPFVAVPGDIQISTYVDGSPENPWLVLSNSLAAPHSMWDLQMKTLLKRYRVLRYDTRGHGQSDVPAAPYSFDDLVGDAVALLDHYQIERATFMGLSMGGMTGLGIALAHPGRLEALVCCDARADAPPQFVQGWNERINAVRGGGLASILPATVERWLSAAFRAAHPDVVADVERMILSTPIVGYEGCAEALKRLDYLKDLHHITTPTLFVGGAEDMAAPPEAMQAMADRIRGSRFSIIAGGAHLSNIDSATGFHDAVKDFLQLD